MRDNCQSDESNQSNATLQRDSQRTTVAATTAPRTLAADLSWVASAAAPVAYDLTDRAAFRPAHCEDSLRAAFFEHEANDIALSYL